MSNQSANEKAVNVDWESESSEKAWEAKLLAMPTSDYMNDEQLQFFRHRLLAERSELEVHLKEVKTAIASHERDSDEADQASFEEELRLALRQADRESRLLNNIGAALKRLRTASTVTAKRPANLSGSQGCFLGPPRNYALRPKNVRRVKNTTIVKPGGSEP